MSKSPKAIQTNETVQVETIETAATETKAFVIPMDGSGAVQYIKDAGGVSKAIRSLTDLNYSRGEVAKMLNKRYQHVRNVLITPIKKSA